MKNSRLKILFTVHGYKPAYKVGGPIISVSSLAEELTRQGHEVTVFTTNCNMSEDLDIETNCPHKINGVEVWYFKRFKLFYKLLSFSSYFSKTIGFLYAPAMAKEMKRIIQNVDLVHTHLPFIYPTYAAAKYARLYQKPLFYHQRGVFDPARLNFRSIKKRIFLALIEKPILKSATTLIALTKAEKESFASLCPNKPCEVIPNGIDVNNYLTTCNSSPDVRINPTSKVILFMGRIHPIKGADRIIEAFIRINNLIPEAILVMAGPDEFGIEKNFKSRVEAAGLNDRILFKGMISGNEKLNWLARADLFSLPSDAEGFSMAVLEALASETPVMISPGCNFPEVESKNCGVIVDNEIDLIAERLLMLLKNDARLKAMGIAGRKLVKMNYNWQTITSKMIEAYQEGIERFRRQTRG